jgi:cobaltochelatase CobS
MGKILGQGERTMVVKPMGKTTVSVGKTFNIKGAEHVTMSAFAEHDFKDYVPASNDGYIFGSSLGDVHVWMAVINEPLLLQGPTGCGKSSLVSEVAARTNRPVFRMNAHNRTEMFDFVGQFVLKDGNTVFVHGPLANAMKIGAWFIVDEIDLAPPGILAGLNTVLEGGNLVIAENGGEVITPHPDFRFIATCNTKGDGGVSTGGAFGGAFTQNAAFLDRFMMVECEYPSEKTEVAALVNKGASSDLATKLVKVANRIREAYESGESSVTCSTRTLLRWASLIPAYQGKPSPAFHALERALLGRVGSKDVKDAIREMCITEGLILGEAA